MTTPDPETALLRIFDLAEDRPDIREVARAALTPTTPPLDEACPECGYIGETHALDCPKMARMAAALTPTTHGRHCPCSACAREDWTRADLASCGMHGPSCPPLYAPERP